MDIVSPLDQRAIQQLRDQALWRTHVAGWVAFGTLSDIVIGGLVMYAYYQGRNGAMDLAELKKSEVALSGPTT